MNKIKITISFALLNFICMSFGFSAGTPAGTYIQSRSMVVYRNAFSTTTDTVYSNYVSFYVAQIAAINVTPSVNASTTTGDSVFVTYPVTITNSGNGTDIVLFSAFSSRLFIIQLYYDSNGDGVLQTSEISAGPITQSNSLSADEQYKMIIRVRIPRDESLDGGKDSISLSTKSNFDTTKSNSGLYVTTIRTADLRSISSGLSVNNPTPEIGSQIIYSLTFSNSGSISATNVDIYDFLGIGFTFVSGTTTQGTFSGGTNPVSWNIGTLASGASVTATLTLLVNSNNSIGTILTDSMTVKYTVGSNDYLVGTNSPTVIVGGNFGVNIIPFVTSLIKEPNDTAVYRFSVKNTGSLKDVIEIQSSSTRNWNWKYYRDGNNNSVWDGSDPLLTNSNGLSGIDVDSVATGDSVRIFAAFTAIPRTKADDVKDTLHVVAISSKDNTNRDSIDVVTNIHEPVISISIVPIVNQPAGAVVTYRINYSNTGSVAVSNFSVTDSIPAFTEYIANSVNVNGTIFNDNTGSVSVLDSGGGKKIISVDLGTLNTLTNGFVEFNVKIK